MDAFVFCRPQTPPSLSAFAGDESMFLRRSRSTDVLGSSKKVDAQQQGSEVKKSKPKLKSMRSFKFLRSPKFGLPPESSHKEPAQTPTTRLDGSTISAPLPDAQGLGIKHFTGPGMSGTSSGTRPVPHARMYNPYSAMSTDMFSTSRPPGTGMRLPPSRTEANVAQDQHLDWEMPSEMAAPASEPLPSVSVFPQMSEPPTEAAHSVGHAAYPSMEHAPEATQMPDAVEVSQTTWPPYHTDPVGNIEDAYYYTNEAPEDRAQDLTMQGYAMQSDVTSPTPQLEAAAVTSPDPSSGLDAAQTRPASRPASLSYTTDPSYGVVDALVRPYDSYMDETANGPESWTLPDSENAQPTTDDAVVPQVGEDATTAAMTRTSIKLDNNTVVTAEPSLYEPQNATKSLPPIDLTQMASHDNRVPQAPSHPERPVSVLPADASYYCVECMLGSHVLVCNDPIVRSEAPRPVAYTYDTWYLDPSTVQKSANITAIVATSPSREEALSVPLHLGVFASHLEPASEGPYVLDVATPLELEVPHKQPSSSSTMRPVPLSTSLRNAALFSLSSHVILAATPRRLVAEMTSGSAPGLLQDVLLGYRPYFSAHRLLELLLQRIEWSIEKLTLPNIASTAQHVLAQSQLALWHWLLYYYEYDFQHDEALSRRLVQWTHEQCVRSESWPTTDVGSPSQSMSYEGEEHLPSDLRDRMQSIYSLVKMLVPDTLLPPHEAANEKRSTGLLHKTRSFSRMLSLTGGHSRRGHSRKSSSAAVAAAAHQDAANMSGDTDMGAETARDVPFPSQIQRNRSLRGLRNMLSPRTDQHDEPSGYEPRHSIRKYETLVPDDEDGDESTEHDAALKLLEEALGDIPRAEDLHQQASKPRVDGPFHWIPRYNHTSWKEAQRMSMSMARTTKPPGASAAPPMSPTASAADGEPVLAMRDSLLLSQRSSTIARQMGIIERELMASIDWSELSEPSWDQHTVRQEQWQLEYQDYVLFRIRQAMNDEPSEGRQDSLRQTIHGRGIHMLIARFNRTCAWVASHIVRSNNIQERVAIVSKFIRVAWHCYRQSNMESLCQIMFGLQSPWVARLQQTWEQVSMWELRAFEALRRFTSPREQFAFLRYSMREAIETNIPSRRFSPLTTSSSPYIPFFGQFVSDLSAVDSLASFVDTSGMPNTMPLYDDQELSLSWDALVNVYRLRIKSHIVREFITLQRCQRQAPVPPMELPILVEVLQLDTLSAMAIQSTSLALEP